MSLRSKRGFVTLDSQLKSFFLWQNSKLQLMTIEDVSNSSKNQGTDYRTKYILTSNLVSSSYDLVENDDEQVGVGAREDGDVHGDGGRVGLVQAHAEVALAAEEEQDEHTLGYSKGKL